MIIKSSSGGKKSLNYMSIFRILIVLGMFLKTIFFMAILETSKFNEMNFKAVNSKFYIAYIGFVLIVFSFGYLFSKKGQIIYYLIISTLYSILLTVDICYFKVNYDLIGVKNILFPGTFNVTGKSFNNFIPLYLVFFIDILIILIYLFATKVRNSEKRNVYKFLYTLKFALLLVLISVVMFDGYSLDGWSKEIVTRQWTVKMSVRAPGPLGFHFVEAAKSIKKSMNKVTDEEKSEVESWLADNKENLPDNEYRGIFKGKNVIFIQSESLENFIINKSTNGKEITPFINSLANNGLYFENFFEQNNAGHSIDCDLMVNTSIFPIGGNTITGTNFGENVYPNSLPKVLERAGYTTITAHAIKPDEFNGTELHINGFGVQQYLHESDFKYEESVGYGLSDKSMFSQLADKLKNVKQPFFVQAPTLSTHGPFNLDEKYRELNLPKEVNDSYLGGYLESFHYFDKQLQMFIEKLDKEGLMDNTVIVFYGDHTGLHKYYTNDIKDIDYEDGWWKVDDHRIPLIIYSKDLEAKKISVHGGQTDIFPTIAYMLGIDKKEYENTTMGKVLVNTNRDATVMKDNVILGEVKNEKEKQHLLNAYRIGEIILRNNYFYKSEKTK